MAMTLRVGASIKTTPHGIYERQDEGEHEGALGDLAAAPVNRLVLEVDLQVFARLSYHEVWKNAQHCTQH